MNARTCFLLSLSVLFIPSWALLAQPPTSDGRPAPTFVEKATIVWDHTGVPTTFTLSFQHRTDGQGDADRLVIRHPGDKPWILLNNEDEWTTLKEVIPTSLRAKNLIRSERMLFVGASGSAPSRVYLILKGGGYGCCDGSLTVITPDNHGSPKVVFHAEEQLIYDVSLLPDGSGIAAVDKSSSSEARSQNAESYDPDRIYIFEDDKPARYDPEKSKEYTIQHYCEWAGPNYNEKFVAVSDGSSMPGAKHCHTITEAEFEAEPVKHPK